MRRKQVQDMCGITGLMSFGPPLGPTHIEAMTTALRHRGPDDEGYLAVDSRSTPLTITPLGGRDSATTDYIRADRFRRVANLYLGHRRLSILDLSTAGHQPM